MNEKLQEIIDFFEQAEGWSKDEIIADYIAEIEDLRGYEPDEIGLQWDDDNVLMVLSDFAEIFFNRFWARSPPLSHCISGGRFIE